MQVFEQRRLLMIETQLRTNKVTDNRVLDAFGVIPREVFVDPERSELAYIDEDLAIGHGRFLLEPMVFARLVQALDLKRRQRPRYRCCQRLQQRGSVPAGAIGCRH